MQKYIIRFKNTEPTKDFVYCEDTYLLTHNYDNNKRNTYEALKYPFIKEINTDNIIDFYELKNEFVFIAINICLN